jgi:predicted metal-dependent hydrolase
MNHSKSFWTEVEKMMKWLFPGDYKTHKDWLKKYWDNLIF